MDKFKEGSFVQFYNFLLEENYQKIKDFACSFLSIFGTTYRCEQTFSLLKSTKSKYSDQHLRHFTYSIDRIRATSANGPQWEPRVQGREARDRYGRQYHALVAPHRSYVQGAQCFLRDTVLCKLDLQQWSFITCDESPQIKLRPTFIYRDMRIRANNYSTKNAQLHPTLQGHVRLPGALIRVETDERKSCKGYTGTRYKYTIAFTRKALNWRAVFSSYYLYIWDFKSNRESTMQITELTVRTAEKYNLVSRKDEGDVQMDKRRSEVVGETEAPRGNTSASGIVRQVFPLRRTGTRDSSSSHPFRMCDTNFLCSGRCPVETWPIITDTPLGRYELSTGLLRSSCLYSDMGYLEPTSQPLALIVPLAMFTSAATLEWMKYTSSLVYDSACENVRPPLARRRNCELTIPPNLLLRAAARRCGGGPTSLLWSGVVPPEPPPPPVQLLEVSPGLATTQEYSGETGWRLGPPLEADVCSRYQTIASRQEAWFPDVVPDVIHTAEQANLMGAIESSMVRRRDERAGGTGDPRENPPTSGIRPAQQTNAKCDTVAYIKSVILYWIGSAESRARKLIHNQRCIMRPWWREVELIPSPAPSPVLKCSEYHLTQHTMCLAPGPVSPLHYAALVAGGRTDPLACTKSRTQLLRAIIGDAPHPPLCLERCARGLLITSFGNPVNADSLRDLLASQTFSRLLEFPIRLPTTQERSGETGWRLSPPRHITQFGEDSRWRPKTLYILPQQRPAVFDGDYLAECARAKYSVDNDWRLRDDGELVASGQVRTCIDGPRTKDCSYNLKKFLKSQKCRLGALHTKRVPHSPQSITAHLPVEGREGQGIWG
ncbi:hypothetical protein PR048_028244 [Dryococelus australis]|uniref:Uncharacterized protein n=1 Tax=Dryococelus australis TaxID=614101 RepID=A0ABQ9GIQ8_9NEOP|nr:hypothetical protein PR048_028244 [Dryococelus australis]